jgi:ribonuclease HI
MLRSTSDPALAAKLLKVIEALRSGATLEKAIESGRLDPETAESLLTAFEAHLSKQARARVAGKARPRSRRLRLSAVSDGASRGNPGQAACAVIISDSNGEELLRRARRLGVVTNNVAEYEGVILALELAETLGASSLVLRLDSELVVKQLNGEYKVKHASLKPLFEKAVRMKEQFDEVEVIHVPRKETEAADKLANAELDGKNDG